MTVLDLIKAAMGAIGELHTGQTPSPEEQERGLLLLNTILAHWETQRRKVYIIDQLQFPLVDGKATYTVGPEGEFNTYRFVKIQAANVVYCDVGQDPARGLRKPLTLAPSIDWAAINERNVQGLRPLKIYNDNDYPLLKLYLWPVPHIPA